MREARRDGQLKSTHGGKREKKTVEEDVWYHPDAKEAMDLFFEEEEEKYSVLLQRLQASHGEMTLPKQPEMDMELDIGDGNPPPAQDDDEDDEDDEDESTHGSVCSDISTDDE